MAKNNGNAENDDNKINEMRILHSGSKAQRNRDSRNSVLKDHVYEAFGPLLMITTRLRMRMRRMRRRMAIMSRYARNKRWCVMTCLYRTLFVQLDDRLEATCTRGNHQASPSGDELKA